MGEDYEKICRDMCQAYPSSGAVADAVRDYRSSCGDTGRIIRAQYYGCVRISQQSSMDAVSAPGIRPGNRGHVPDGPL